VSAGRMALSLIDHPFVSPSATGGTGSWLAALTRLSVGSCQNWVIACSHFCTLGCVKPWRNPARCRIFARTIAAVGSQSGGQVMSRANFVTDRGLGLGFCVWRCAWPRPVSSGPLTRNPVPAQNGRHGCH
jgi:hypothetical protein